MNQQMTVTLLLFGFCLGSCSQFPPRKYFFVDKPMPWYDAQQYCRKHYTDLATYDSMDDIWLEPPFSYLWAWIGLWDDPNSWKYKMGNESNSWRWSTTGETSKTGYQKWGYGNPDYYESTEGCVGIYDGRWLDTDCETESPFICYKVAEPNVKQYVYISTLATWSSAQTYCRAHYTDLAMIENEEENIKAKGSQSKVVEAWIGLYRVPWVWSDKSPSLFRLWDSFLLKNTGGNQHCVAKNALHQWDDASCSVTNVFICHKVVKINTIVKMTTVTDSDLTDPAINAQVLQQLGALLTSQGWTDFKMQWKTLPKKEDKK